MVKTNAKSKRSKLRNRRKAQGDQTLLQVSAGPGYRSRADKALLRMIMNPCHATLVPGPQSGYGSSYVIRLRQRFSFHSVAAANNGHVIWFPSYHCGTTNSVGSMYAFESVAFLTTPNNTAAVPYGTSTVVGGNTAYRISDPAYSFLNTSAESARTLAACATIIYTGATVNCSGEIAVVNNVDPVNVLYSAASLPTSTDQLFGSAQYIGRVPASKMDVRYLPNDTTCVYKSNGSVPNTYPDVVDSPFAVGTAATSATVLGQNLQQDSGIAIAWSGLSTAQTNDLVIEFTKIVEWRPKLNVNIVAGQTNDSAASSFADVLRGAGNMVTNVVQMYSDMRQLMGGHGIGEYQRQLQY